MDGQFLGTQELNEKQKTQEELELSTQELYDIKRQMETLELPEGFKPIAIKKYKELKLADDEKYDISQKDVYAIELENDEEERQTLLYTLRNKELVLIARIRENNQLLMELSERERYTETDMVQPGDLDEPYVIDEEYRRTMEEQKEAELLLEDRDNVEAKKAKKMDKQPERKETQEESRSKKIAAALGMTDEDKIMMVVEVKDETTMSRVLNKNLETTNLYAVKLREDNGGVGSNDWVIVRESATGEFTRAMKEDNSDTMQDIAQKLGMKGTMVTDRALKEGDIGGVSQSWDDVRYYTVNQYRFADNTTIVMVQTERDSDKSDIHFYRVEDGKLIPICDEEHAHREEEVPLNDENLEIEEDKAAEEERLAQEEEEEQARAEEEETSERDEGGRTPGDDAWERRFEHSH